MNKRLSKKNYDFIKLALKLDDWKYISLNRPTIKCLFNNYNKSMYDFFVLEDELEELQQENKQLKSIINTLIKEYNLEPTEYVENLLKGDSNDTIR